MYVIIKLENMMDPQRGGIKGFGFFNLVSSLNTASDSLLHAAHKRKGVHKKRPSQWFLLLCFMHKKAKIPLRN